jgi:hypothetical protein
MSRPNPSAGSDAAKAGAAGPPRVQSSQMQAVMRLMTGQEERTLAQKLADPNRPTWEQYKKDNEEKLNLEGVDNKKMEEYRQQLDAERDKFLSRGTNHGKKKSKEKKRKKRHRKDSSDSDSDSDDSSDDDRRRKKHKKRKKKHKKRHRHRDDSSGDGDDGEGGDHDSSGSDDSGDRKRKHKSSKHKKKKKKKRSDSGNESEGSHYRLSKFFDGSDASE